MRGLLQRLMPWSRRNQALRQGMARHVAGHYGRSISEDIHDRVACLRGRHMVKMDSNGECYRCGARVR